MLDRQVQNLCHSRNQSKLTIRTKQTYNLNKGVSLIKILSTVKTLNIGTPRLTTVVVLNIKQFNFTMQ